LNLETIAKLINADASQLSESLFAADVAGFSIDSRAVKSGDLFFALAQPDYANNGFNGDFTDSHQFLADAFAHGAVAAVVRVDKLPALPAEFAGRLLVVEDCIAALQRLAAGVYRNWGKPVVGITGSAGKTTAKELCAQVLAQNGFRVLRNEKNYNNGLGHPLTVLRLARENDFDVAVLEMGMSTPLNEIERLCRISPPDVAVELNVLPVHIEHLGTIERIAQAKAELVENMKPSGVAVLNADDERVAAMRELSSGSRVLTYGIANKADVSASAVRAVRFGETRFQLHTPLGEADVVLRLTGQHNVSNALAAAAVGVCFDLAPAKIAAALETVAPPPMRGEILRFRAGFEVINDSYNSNPDALLGMVTTLIENGAHARRKIVVAGEMLELGQTAGETHRGVGEKIADAGVDVLWGVRGFARDMIAGAQAGNIAEARFFEDSAAAADEIVNLLRAGDLVLVKGSRGVRMEKVVERLLENFEKQAV
jgi:UDP-N-acetylmuramoyl-tripeptide--D-alanyl-D-alanine ligase